MNKQILLHYKIHLILIGSFLGYISWSFQDIRLTIFSIGIFYAYIQIEKRIDLFIITLSYLLVSSRGLLIGTITYYDNNFIAGLTVWLSAALLTSIPYILIWSNNRSKRFLLLPLLVIVLIAPGFGYISWVNPIISTSLIFPGFGFLGFVLFILLFYLYFGINNLYKTILLVIIAFNIIIKFPTENQSIQNINTKYEIALKETENAIVRTTYNLFPFLPKNEDLAINKEQFIENFIISRLASFLIPGLNVISMIIFLLTLSMMLSIYKKFGRPLSFVLIIFILLNIKYTTHKETSFDSLNTKYDYNPESIDFRASYTRQMDLLNNINRYKGKNVVAPESILGFYNSNSAAFIWDQVNKNVLAGAYIKDKSNNQMYDNVVLLLTPKVKKIVYKQRVPVLISMWKPWTQKGAKANLFNNPIVKVLNKNIAFFVCYEQLLDFTFLHSAFKNPDLFIGISNLWWASNTTIELIQRNRLELYSMLFNKPYLYSVNR
jgi:hypothetical protein